MKAQQGTGLLSVGESAQLLGLDARTVRSWVRDDRVPGLGVLVGRRTFIRAAVLERFLRGGFSLRSISSPVESAHRSDPTDSTPPNAGGAP